MRIAEVAKQMGVRASTLRYYERRGILEPTLRVRQGQRRYDSAALDRLRFIRLAQRAGLTLSEIREMLHGFPAGATARARWQSLRSGKIRALEERIQAMKAAQHLLRATAQCRCRDLDECGRKLLNA